MTPARLIRTLPGAIAGLLACLLPLAASHAHYAHHATDTCSIVNSSPTTYATVNVGRDAPVKRAIGPWITLPTAIWVCTRKADHVNFVPPGDRYEVEALFGPGLEPNLKVFPGNATIGDDSYTLYHTDRAVGFIARVSYEMQGEPPTAYIPLKAGLNGVVKTNLYGGGARKHDQFFTFKATVQVRLVKLGQGIYKNDRYEFRPVQIRLNTPKREHKGSIHSWIQQARRYNPTLNTKIPNDKAACTTPPVQVSLGVVKASDLKYLGNTGPATDFAMRFERCPQSLAAIRYRFEPTNPGKPVFEGGLKLDNNATAQGVEVQILDANNTPLKFTNEFTVLTAYNPEASPQPVYTVPLKARVIRTLALGRITGGTVQAGMRMVVEYR